MAADDYAVAGGGALKLKGGKVHKSKKKKKDKSKEGSSNLERSLSIVEGESSKDVAKREKGDKKQRDDPQERAGTPKNPDENDDEDPADYKTEAERRHEEIQRRKVSSSRTGIRTRLLPETKPHADHDVFKTAHENV